MHENITLDGFDTRLIELLQSDGRLTNQELADRVHLSASQCSRRRARLETSGLIRGYRAEVDRRMLGYGLTVFINVTLATHDRDNADRFAALVAGLDSVLEAHALTGEMDYLLKVVVRDLQRLASLVNDVLLPHEAVQNVRSTICLYTMKESSAVPVPGPA